MHGPKINRQRLLLLQILLFTAFFVASDVGRWGARGALLIRRGSRHAASPAAGLLPLGVLLVATLAEKRVHWKRADGGRCRHNRPDSLYPGPVSSPNALYYFHHFRSRAACTVGAVGSGGHGQGRDRVSGGRCSCWGDLGLCPPGHRGRAAGVL